MRRGYRVLTVDPVPERRAMAERHGVLAYDLTTSVVEEWRDLIEGSIKVVLQP